MEDWWSVFFVSFPLSDREGQETLDDETLKAMSPLKSARFLIDCLFVVKGMSEVLCSGSSCLGGSLWCNCCDD